MKRAISTAVLAALIGVLWLAACGESNLAVKSGERSSDKPDTFHDPCELDSGVCAAPFECVPVKISADDFETRSICSQPCEQSSDCPHWFEPSGHCSGNIQAQCLEGFCQAWCV